MRNSIHLFGGQTRPLWRKRWLVMVLIVVSLLPAIPLTMPASTYAASATDPVELDTVAAQRATEAAAAHKGVIWLPHAKWKTANGYNWEGIESDLQDMKAAHVGWIRIFLRQDLPMSFHDRLVPLVAQYNLKLLPVVKKTDPQEALGTPEQQQRYREWLHEVVTRYHGTVRYWEIENETNIPQGWAICCHGDPEAQAAYIQSVKDYLTLLKMAHEVIKGIDPTLQVLIAGLCEAGAERYIEELIAQNAHRYFDLFSYHPFGGRPEKAVDRLDAARAALAAQPELAAKPIWITAIGYHAEAGWKAPGQVPSEAVKADYLLQTMQLMRDAEGVEGPIFWYAVSEPSQAKGYGLIQIDTTTTPYRKVYLPAYKAMQELWVTRFVKILPPISDSFVSMNNPKSNFGASQQLKIGYGSDVREAYLKFDLAALAGYTLLETHFRFQTPSATDAGSAATQTIRMLADPFWSERAVNYNNQPMPIVGTFANTSANKVYQLPLTTFPMQRAVGGQLFLNITSQSPDELVIFSREATYYTPKLVVYYTNAAAAAGEEEVVIATAEELPPLKEGSATSAPLVEDLYAGSEGDPYAGYPYEIDETEEIPATEESHETDESEQGTDAPGLYLPYVEQ